MLCCWSSRVPYMYCRSFLLIQCNSTVAYSRLVAAPRRDHIPRTPFAPQYMGTWTDRLKRRWQSGDQTKDDKKTDDVSCYSIAPVLKNLISNTLFCKYVCYTMGSLFQAKCETTADNGDSSELEKTLSEKEEQIKASEEKIKDLKVNTSSYFYHK